MEKQIFKAEDELDELRKEFEALQAGKKVPLKKV